MHVELAIPGLLSVQAARAGSLELLLARGRRTSGGPQRIEAWLQEAFGLEGRLPAGALSVLGAGAAPGDASWTRADPVHMQIQRERIVLAPASAIAVSREEASTLCAALNRHFAGTLEFRALDAGRWCARLERDMDLGDEPPLDMGGREATTRPGDALLTEVQMLLHADATNAAREARGEPPLNSVWFWGAGHLPAAVESRWRSVTSDDPLALGLAKLSRAAARARPATAVDWLAQSPEDGRHLVLLDAATGVEALERDWFAPLAAALRTNRLGMISLHIPDAGLAVETVRGDLRRFWRRPKALDAYA